MSYVKLQFYEFSTTAFFYFIIILCLGWVGLGWSSTHSHFLTLCLIGGIIGRMENNGWKMVWKTVFSIVWEAKEKREDGKLRRKFSSWAHQFFSSQIRRKTVDRKCSHCAIIGVPSPYVCKFINSTPIFINSTSISNPENQQHTHIHQTHIKIHQTHIQIHINNQSEN